MPEITDEALAALTAEAAKGKAYDEVKADMLKHKDAAAAKEKELEALRGKQTDAEKAALLEQNKFKELYEKEQAEKAAAVKAKEEAVGTVDRYIKQGALETEALKLGLKKEALSDLKLLGTEALQVTKEGNEIKVKGVEDFIATQKKLRPHWFGEGTAPILNGGGGNGGGGGGGGEMTTTQLLEMQKKDPEKYRAYITERMKAGPAKK